MQVAEDPNSKALRSSKKWFGKCWIWQGSFFQSGYGRYFSHQKTYRAHRVSFYLYNGTLTNNLFICHKCDNPACVNPQHLFEGSPLDNTRDMIKKKRLVPERGKWKNKSSQYYGVTYRKDGDIWRINCMINYKKLLKGNFNTELEAAEAYDQGLIRLFSEGVLNYQKPLNFPEKNKYSYRP